MSEQQLNIKHLQPGDEGEFFIANQDEKLGLLAYSLPGDSYMVIKHTEVDPSLRGQGAARQLLDAAVAYARSNGLKIRPVCEYARAVMKKHPDTYADILA